VIKNLSDGVSPGEWAGIGFVAAIVVMILITWFFPKLKERYQWARRLEELGPRIVAGALTTTAVFYAMSLFVIVLLGAFSPGLNEWLVDQAPVVQAAVLVVLGAIAVVALRLVLRRNRRDQLVTGLLDRPFGVLTAPAFLLVLASVALSASSALLLVGADHKWWALLAPSGQDPTPQVVGSHRLAEGALTSKLVLWHMLDLIPIVKLPQTLAWDQPPLSYEDWGVGMVLLALKGVAGVALLASGKALLDAWPGRHERRAQRAIKTEGGTDSGS
jgi:hypothetical protein